MARLKHIEAFCNYCNKVTKLEIVGEINIVENDYRKWARCKSCKHTMMMDIEGNIKSSSSLDLSVVKNKDCKNYSPFDTYEIGDSVFHVEWNDRGKITAKETTSSGANAIVVDFENIGIKKLLEQFKKN